MSLKVAAYARYSSDMQREESIDAQLRAIEAYCAANGLKVVETYIDEAMSATNDNRPMFQRMIADSKSQAFEAIVVHKLDRFARNRYDSAIYGKRLQQNGVKVLSVLERLDDSPESVILRSVIEGYNEYYSLNLARETMKGLKENAYKAQHNGGLPPLGYEVESDKTYKINDHEAEAVRLIYRMYLEGEGYGSIADALNYLGYKSKTGKAFGKNSVYDILENEKYTGVYIYNKRKGTQNGVKQNRAEKDPSEVIRIDGGMPAIISKNDFLRVRHKRKENKRKSGSFSAKEEYALSGLLRCGKCGGAMTGARHHAGRNKSLYVTYECSTRKRTKGCDAKPINRDHIEGLVYSMLQDEILQVMSQPDYITQLQDKLDVNREKNLIDLSRLKKRLAENEKQSDNLINAIANGTDPSFLGPRIKLLQEEKLDLKKSIDNLEYTIVENRINVEDLAESIKRINPDIDRAVLFKSLLESVSVDEEAVRLQYRVLATLTGRASSPPY